MKETSVGRASIARLVTLVVAALVAMPTTVLAHDEPVAPHEDEPGQPSPESQAPRERLNVVLNLPDEVRVGEVATIEALVTHADDGDPVEGLTVTFEAPAAWGEELGGPMSLGTAMTDHEGAAVITTDIRAAGDLDVTARVEGAQGFRTASAEASLEVIGQRQMVVEDVGLHIPWLNLWVLAGVIGLVWALFLIAANHLRGISRATVPPSATDAGAEVGRRQFLGRALPIGVQAGILAIGAGLLGLVARSPRTHGNLLAPPETESYRRTPVAFVGRFESMREMPAPLDRSVSFRDEVLPIFMRFGGPHVVQPENSPPPGGLRLDSWKAIMEMGVVVPGEPERSELVEHLLSPGMQMPPSRPPLPDETIQLIVSWIAQGARDD